MSDSLVEHVDIMATVIEAAGLPPLPTCPPDSPWKVDVCTEGTSFLPLVFRPNQVHLLISPIDLINRCFFLLRMSIPFFKAWKNASFSQYLRYDIMGYSMTTSTNHRFTAWVDFDISNNKPLWTMKNPLVKPAACHNFKIVINSFYFIVTPFLL